MSFFILSNSVWVDARQLSSFTCFACPPFRPPPHPRQPKRSRSLSSQLIHSWNVAHFFISFPANSLPTCLLAPTAGCRLESQPAAVPPSRPLGRPIAMFCSTFSISPCSSYFHWFSFVRPISSSSFDVVFPPTRRLRLHLLYLYFQRLCFH